MQRKRFHVDRTSGCDPIIVILAAMLLPALREPGKTPTEPCVSQLSRSDCTCRSNGLFERVVPPLIYNKRRWGLLDYNC
jgi:hypothetical protein